MKRAIGLQPLELILEDVSAAIAANNEGYLTIGHVIKKLAAVAPDFAHNLLKEVMGGQAFFGLSAFAAGFISSFTTDGILYHSLRRVMTAVMSSVTSRGVAS